MPHFRCFNCGKTNQARKAKAIYTELTIARERAPVVYVLADSKAGTGVGKLLAGKGRLHMCPGEAVGRLTGCGASYVTG